MTVNLLDPTEVEAAELEALRTLDPSDPLYAKIMVARDLKAKRDDAVAAYDKVKDEIGAALAADNLQGFLVGSKVVARRSIVRTSRFDSKAFKAKHPVIWGRFVSITESVRVSVD